MDDDSDNIFAEFDDEFLKYERIESMLSKRPDLHAFLLIDSLFPETTLDMIAASEHDEFYLEPDPHELAAKATKEQLRDLHRCGVRHAAWKLTMRK